jgi:hypothetical protein
VKFLGLAESDGETGIRRLHGDDLHQGGLADARFAGQGDHRPSAGTAGPLQQRRHGGQFAISASQRWPRHRRPRPVHLSQSIALNNS